MTTVVANRECMAADERVTSGEPLFPTTKIFRIKGSLFGFCGDLHRCHVMLEWLKGKRDRLELFKLFHQEDGRYELELLELNKSGLSLWNGWGVPIPIHADFYAVGSGGMAAVVSMKKHNDPIQAVKDAMDFDEATGPPIRVEYLRQSKRAG